MILTQSAATKFKDVYGHAPLGTVFMPGRVNLIGEHVDYNEGLVLPMPVPEGTAIAWAHADNEKVDVVADDFNARDSFLIHEPTMPDAPDWRSYVRGMCAEAPAKPKGGLKLLITGNLPRGSGLSSSASLCVAVGQVLAEAADAQVDPVALAKAAQQTEHQWAGVACGIMDQMAVAAGEAGKALLLDCRDLSRKLVTLPEDWAIATVESGVSRGLGDGEYNARRAQCESAAAKLNVRSLRDADWSKVEAAALNDLERKRALHVVAEIERVRQAASAIACGDMATLAATLRDGHASLRNLFEVSVPEVDILVDRINVSLGGRGGARMTGGGFGGAIVIALERSAMPLLRDTLDHPIRIVF